MAWKEVGIAPKYHVPGNVVNGAKEQAEHRRTDLRGVGLCRVSLRCLCDFSKV